MSKILIAGESWMSHTIHVKGFDSFTTSVYEEGVEYIKKALEEGGYEVDFLPNHLAADKFPTTLEELNQYEAVILSDIGSNTLLLPKSVFTQGKKLPNRLELVKEYVEKGGSFLMVGGYMSFTGIDAKTRYGETAVKDILPIRMLDTDDRVEAPQGFYPQVVKEHEILNGIPKEWPHFLGYNKTIALEDRGEHLVTIDGDPFISVMEYGKGRTAIFTSDCAPHWGPVEFLNWEYYNKLWINILNWMTRK
ncbi:glutamine amidotransferase [Clostridium sp. UBA6640]|uniref:glutamine amidotransferase n=1 Tax=Clostridium sp. UBA6640 TaxID=1946370 RepID=UPI0025C06281|nr:glutamine amidotransferase [Clostridium sp. UBA6640]